MSKTVTVTLDTDPTKQLKLQLAEFQNINEAIVKIGKAFGVQALQDVNERSYGIRSKTQGVFISRFEDLSKSRNSFIFENISEYQ